MKTKITLFLVSLFALGCSNDSNFDNPKTATQYHNTGRPTLNFPKDLPPANKVLLLKVDFLTHTFEGGKLLFFEPAGTFSIASEYQSPGDFGGVTLRYAETDQMLFSGTIHWMGLGEMSYPESLSPAATFQTNVNPVPVPTADLLSKVAYYDHAYYPDPMPYQSIWNAIDNLHVVAQFRSSNPNSAVNVFLYTPSVGIGNPEDWDYFVILKN